MIRRLTRLAAARHGTTAIEFAIIAPVFMLMLMGFFDLGHKSYIRAVLQGAIQKAARDGTIEAADTAALNASVQAQVKPVSGATSTFSTSWRSYSTFSQVGQPEPYKDANGDGAYNSPECFEDENGNGAWDAVVGLNGLGGASDVVLYTVSVSYPRIFPMYGLLGWPRNETVSASTVLRNQPWSAQTVPVVTKCP